MCSISVIPQPSGVSVFMNRDEKKGRAKPDMLHTGSEVYPVDPQGGGTWIGANHHGLVLALLNFYPKRFKTPGNLKSRGTLIPDLLKDSKNIPEALQKLQMQNLKSYAPFRLVFVQAGQGIELRIWNGRIMKSISKPFGRFFLASSSFKDRSIRVIRTRRFWDRSVQVPESDLSLAPWREIHHCRDVEIPAQGVLMSREDAETTTICEVHVKKDWLQLEALWNPQDSPGQARKATAEIKLA